MANLLMHEESPYLQQHKENPVDWYAWCDEAFEEGAGEASEMRLGRDSGRET